MIHIKQHITTTHSATVSYSCHKTNQVILGRFFLVSKINTAESDVGDKLKQLYINKQLQQQLYYLQLMTTGNEKINISQ